jgi:hypothetical protein
MEGVPVPRLDLGPGQGAHRHPVGQRALALAAHLLALARRQCAQEVVEGAVAWFSQWNCWPMRGRIAGRVGHLVGVRRS